MWDETALRQAQEDISPIIRECYVDTKKFATTFFPEAFFLPFSLLHDEMFSVLDDDTIQKACIVAPRGFGKSTILNLLYPAKRILYQDSKFILSVSNSETQAEMQTESLKDELFENERIVNIFGPRKSKKFARDMWQVQTPEGNPSTMILPRGAGQKLRGVKQRIFRPDLITVDDLEDDEAVESETQRAKLHKWFFSALLNTVDQHRGRWRVITLGSILHEDSLLIKLSKDPTWHFLRLSICDDNYRSLWPALYSDEDIQKMVESYRSQGLLDVFAREFMGIAVNPEDRVFPKDDEYRRYMEADLELWKNLHLYSFVLVDPAKTAKLHSDFSAIVGVSVDIHKSRIYVRKVISEKLTPDQLIEKTFDVANAIGARTLGVEVTSLSDWIEHPYKSEIVNRGGGYDFVALHARKKKEDRAKMLIPWYKKGMVWHNQMECQELELQQMAFPRPHKWDVLDAFAYAIQLLEEKKIYQLPTGQLSTKAAVKKRYEELRQEQRKLMGAPKRRWRVV